LFHAGVQTDMTKLFAILRARLKAYFVCVCARSLTCVGRDGGRMFKNKVSRM
jgi:hypothetical protein